MDDPLAPPAARVAAACQLLDRAHGRPVQAQAITLDSAIQVQPVAPPMMPSELKARIREMLADGEAAAGLPLGNGTDAQRLKTIIAANKPITPALFRAIHEKA
jgi:hypothetical protein